MKFEFDRSNKNFKIILDSLKENRASLKNLEEKLDFIKISKYSTIRQNFKIRRWKTKTKTSR